MIAIVLWDGFMTYWDVITGPSKVALHKENARLKQALIRCTSRLQDSFDVIKAEKVAEDDEEYELAFIEEMKEIIREVSDQ